MPQVSSVGLTPSQQAMLQSIVNSSPSAAAAYFGTSTPTSSSTPTTSSGGSSSGSSLYVTPTQTTTTASGELPYQTWERLTGKPWSQASALGLTTGTAADNLALQNKLLGGWLPTSSSSTSSGSGWTTKSLTDVNPTTRANLERSVSQNPQRYRNLTFNQDGTVATYEEYTAPTNNVNQNTPPEEVTTESPGDNPEDPVGGILKSYQDLLDQWIASGKKITPNDITPAQAAQWANQASAEVDPYYQQQIKAIQSDLNSSFDNLQKEYELTAAEKNASFRQSLGLQRESEASQGTTFSGGRTAREQSLQSSAQRDLSSLENTTRYNAQKGLNETERTIGSLNLGGISVPKLSSYSASLQGKGGVNQTGSSNLYSPTGGITGSLEYEQANKKREYADLLKYNYLNEYNI